MFKLGVADGDECFWYQVLLSPISPNVQIKCSDSKGINFAVFFSSAYLEKVLWRELDEKSWNPFQAWGFKEPDASQDWHRNGAALAPRQWTNRFSAPKTTASGKKRQVQLSDVSVSLSKQRQNAERWERCPRVGTESPYGPKDKTGQGRNYGGMGLMTALWGQQDVGLCYSVFILQAKKCHC